MNGADWITKNSHQGCHAASAFIGREYYTQLGRGAMTAAHVIAPQSRSKTEQCLPGTRNCETSKFSGNLIKNLSVLMGYTLLECYKDIYP
jgi:hypothetical protein